MSWCSVGPRSFWLVQRLDVRDDNCSLKWFFVSLWNWCGSGRPLPLWMLSMPWNARNALSMNLVVRCLTVTECFLSNPALLKAITFQVFPLSCSFLFFYSISVSYQISGIFIDPTYHPFQCIMISNYINKKGTVTVSLQQMLIHKQWKNGSGDDATSSIVDRETVALWQYGFQYLILPGTWSWEYQFQYMYTCTLKLVLAVSYWYQYCCQALTFSGNCLHAAVVAIGAFTGNVHITVIALSALLPEYNTHIKWWNQLSINSSPWL